MVLRHNEPGPKGPMPHGKGLTAHVFQAQYMQALGTQHDPTVHTWVHPTIPDDR